MWYKYDPGQKLSVPGFARMKFSLFTLALSRAVSATSYSSNEYASGAVHERLMNTKRNQWFEDAAAGRKEPTQWQSWKSSKGHVECKEGFAIVEPGNVNQTFRCNNASLDVNAMRTCIDFR